MEKTVQYYAGHIKWFGGKNNQTGRENHFGFVNKGADSLFVHRKDLLCHHSYLDEDTPVVFTIVEEKGKTRATNLQLMKSFTGEELPTDVLLAIISGEDTELAIRVLPAYCTKTGDIPGATEKIRQLSPVLRTKALNRFSLDVLQKQPELRQLYPFGQYLRVCEEILRDEASAEEAAGIVQELVQRAAEEGNVLDPMPDKWLRHYPELRKKCSPQRQFAFLLTQWEENHFSKRELIQELTPLADVSLPEDLWLRIPSKIMFEPGIFPHIPSLVFFRLIQRFSEHKQLSDAEKETCLSVLKEKATNRELQEIKLSHFPEWVRSSKEVFLFLRPEDQIDYGWAYVPEYWSQLSREAKLFAVYRSAKEKDYSLIPFYQQEPDLLVKAALMMLSVPVHGESHHPFLRVKKLIDEFLDQECWASTEKLEVWHVIPDCQMQGLSGVSCCEGRKSGHVPAEGEQHRVFCPRLSSRNARRCPNHPFAGARIIPHTHLSWKDWTLMELMEETGIMVTVPVHPNDHYILKLGGHINRINEIRQHLACTTCQELMKPDLRFAKNFAVYNVTHFNCEQAGNHDRHVYLSHCWKCRKVVDSRVSQIQVEGYHLCIHCGAGPEHSHSYVIGSRCPKCGSHDMNDSPWLHGIHCKACSHVLYNV